MVIRNDPVTVKHTKWIFRRWKSDDGILATDLDFIAYMSKMTLFLEAFFKPMAFLEYDSVCCCKILICWGSDNFDSNQLQFVVKNLSQSVSSWIKQKKKIINIGLGWGTDKLISFKFGMIDSSISCSLSSLMSTHYDADLHSRLQSCKKKKKKKKKKKNFSDYSVGSQ